QATGNRQVQPQALLGNPRSPSCPDQLVQPGDAVGGPGVAAKLATQAPQDFIVAALCLGEGQHTLGLFPADTGLLGHLRQDEVRTGLGQLVQRAQDRSGLAGQADLFQQAVEYQTVVDAHLEALEPQRAHQVVDDQGGLDVAGVGGGSDGVEVALPELAEAS